MKWRILVTDIFELAKIGHWTKATQCVGILGDPVLLIRGSWPLEVKLRGSWPLEVKLRGSGLLEVKLRGSWPREVKLRGSWPREVKL